MLKAKTRKDSTPKMTAGGKASTGVSLVGTYREKQLAWIRKLGVYNYPVREDDTLNMTALENVGELWLYADVKGTRHAFEAAFVGRMTRAAFLSEYPDYAKKVGTPKHESYYVFKVSPLYGSRFDNPIVLARTADFGRRTAKVRQAIERFKADGAFAPLDHYLPADLSKVPHRLLCVCEPGVQMDFMDILDNVKELQRKMMDGCDGATMRFIDLFAGIGGIRKGFELACAAKGIKSRCVFTSEGRLVA